MEELEITSKVEYLRDLQLKFQDSIVNYKSDSTNTVNDYIWTYKTTSCDILSVITTTNILKHGNMKDIKLRNKELRR